MKRDSSIQRSREVPATVGWRFRATSCGPSSVLAGAKTGNAASTTGTRSTGLRSGARGATGSRSRGCERRQGQVEWQLQVVVAAAREALSGLPGGGATGLWLQQLRRWERRCTLRCALAQHASRKLWSQQPPCIPGRSPGARPCPQWQPDAAADVDVQVQPEPGVDGSNSIPTASHAVKRVMISLDTVANIGRQSKFLPGRTSAANFLYIGSHTR